MKELRFGPLGIRYLGQRLGRQHGETVTLNLARVFFQAEFDKDGDLVFSYDNRHTMSAVRVCVLPLSVIYRRKCSEN